jgi:hypothetical protein
MINRFFGNNLHYTFHLVGATLFAIGLPSSKIILSISTLLLFINLLLERDFYAYWKQIKVNRLLHFLLIFASLHFVSLLWTTDFHYALNDLRIKLTLFAIPILLACKPFEPKSIRVLLGFFVATLLVTSLFNVFVFAQQTNQDGYQDIRALSFFGSHIRYGILIAIGAGILLSQFGKVGRMQTFIYGVLLVWFGFYSYYSQVLSGILSFLIVLGTFAVMYFFQKSKTSGYLALAICLSIPIGLMIYLVTPKQKQVFYPEQLSIKTAQGNLYSHNLSANTYVNGRPVLAFVCEKELKEAWEKRSSLPYLGKDSSDQPVRFTIMRYMTSKDLKKDAEGVKRLSHQDIENIERGMTSVEEKKIGLLARLEGIKWQIHNSSDPNGHSLLQRIEFWKNGWEIIRENWLLGVGVGDVQDAFDRQYAKNNTLLSEENRLRAHNSFFTAWISFGLLGLLTFTWMNFYYLYDQIVKANYLGLIFISIAIVTFMIEDTLETQMGVSFFAFFYIIFSQPLSAQPVRSDQENGKLVSAKKA